MDTKVLSKSHRLPWVDIAKGMAIILMVIGHEVTSHHTYALIYSFHMPLFFILSGYTFRPVTTWLRWWQKVKKAFVQVWLLAILMIALLGVETILLVKDFGIQGFLHSVLGGIFWSSNNSLRGMGGVGVMWFLIVFFWAKILFDTLQVIAPSWGRGVVLLLLSIGSFLIAPNPLHWLPQALDIVPVAALFMWLGELWKMMDNRFDYRSMGTRIGSGLLGIFWLACVGKAIYIELSVRHYPLFLVGSVVEAFAGTILVCLVAKWVVRSQLLNRLLTTIGKHTLAVMCIHHLDLYWVNWGGLIHSWPLAAAIRLLLDMFLLFGWLYLRSFFSKQHG